MRRRLAPLFSILATVTTLACAPIEREPDADSAGTYNDLVLLFEEWRSFEMAEFDEGIPDYTASAMTAQRTALADWQARLESFETSGWSVQEQVDWQLVRAEMNGLDFDHRVRQPWARDPAFYVTIYPAESDVPAHEGTVIHGWIDL